MKEVVISLINAMMFLGIALHIGNKIYKEKIKFNRIENIMTMIIYVTYLVLNAYMKEKVLKVVLAYTMLMGLYKMIYKKPWNQTTKGSLMVFLIMFTSEIISGLCIGMINQTFNIDLFSDVGYSIVLNIFVIVLMLIIFTIFSKQIKNSISIERTNRKYTNIIIYVVILVSATLIINKLDFQKWLFNFEFLVNVILFSVFLILFLYLSRQNERYEKTKEKYTELVDYSKINDELLEEYRMKSHEFKNQLAIIKSMSNEKDKDLEKYLETLIKKNEQNKYSWVNDVKYIQLAGLKGLINYKIMEMKSLDLQLQINISNEVKKFKFLNFSEETKDRLYSIIGVFLDNAKEAAMSSKEKEVIIDIRIEENDLIIEIGNTYSGKINLEKLGEYNYTTKGKSRGVGLHLVKELVHLDKKFEINSYLKNNLFFQKLEIKK